MLESARGTRGKVTQGMRAQGCRDTGKMSFLQPITSEYKKSKQIWAGII